MFRNFFHLTGPDSKPYHQERMEAQERKEAMKRQSELENKKKLYFERRENPTQQDIEKDIEKLKKFSEIFQDIANGTTLKIINPFYDTIHYFDPKLPEFRFNISVHRFTFSEENMLNNIHYYPWIEICYVNNVVNLNGSQNIFMSFSTIEYTEKYVECFINLINKIKNNKN